MRKKWRRIALGSFLVLVGGVVVTVWVMAGSVASPARRQIQDYHRSYLEEPESHGVQVMRRNYLEGKVPCLVVRPDREAGAAERGNRLRSQLGESGVVLSDYGEENGVAVLLHGRNGRKEDLLPVAERFCAIGMVCIMPDLPSHGESPIETVGFGQREFERSLPGEIANAACKEFGWLNLDQVLWGMSMGGSFAVHAAALEPDRWKSLVIVASFDRLESVVNDTLGWFSGALGGLAGAMIAWRGGPEVSLVNPVIEASKVKAPVLVIHGEEDDFILLERGEGLISGFQGKRKFVRVSGGNHDNVLITEAPVYAEMARWFMGKAER